MSPSATSASFRFFQSNSSPNFSFNTSCYIDVTLYRSLRALRNSCSGYSAVDILLCKSAHSGVTLSSASQCLYTVISIVIPRVFSPQPEVIHQAAAKFVSRLEKRVALARELPLSVVLSDKGDSELSQQTRVYRHIITLFPRCHSISILTTAPWSEDIQSSARWSSVSDFLRPSYPRLLELHIGMHDVQSLGIPAGLQEWSAKLIASAPNLLSLRFTKRILNNMRGGSSTLEDLVIPDVELRVDVLVRTLKHYSRLRKLTLGSIRTGYYFTPFHPQGVDAPRY